MEKVGGKGLARVATWTESHEARYREVYDSSAFKVPLISEIQEMLRYRFLIWNMVTRDLKVRYKRSVLGFVWVILNPLLQSLVLYLVFSQVFRFGVQHFVTYLLGGMLAWGLFSQGTVAAMNNLKGNAPILHKLYVPPSVFVVSAIGSALINLLFSLLPYLVIAVINGCTPALSWLYIVVPMLEITVFSLGMGLIVSALYAFFHDTAEIYAVLLQAFYYLTPIFYSVKVLPPFLKAFEAYNPMNLFISEFRDTIISGTIPTFAQFAASLLMSLGVLIVGWTIFTRVEKAFVYHI